MEQNVRSINGKSLKQVVEELQAPFPEEAIEYLNSNEPYISVHNIVQRLDEALGTFGWSSEVISLDYVPSEKPCFAATVKVSILDDLGNVVASRSTAGGYECKFESDETYERRIQKNALPAGAPKLPISMGNDSTNAVQNAFKKACKEFGIGAVQLRELRKQNKKKSFQQQSPAEIFTVSILTPFTSLSNAGYKAEGQVGDERLEIVLWSEGIKTIGDKMKDKNIKSFTDWATRKTVKLHGRINFYKGVKQIIVTDFEK